jgi:DNA-binding transcriptional ArsR family regulator
MTVKPTGTESLLHATGPGTADAAVLGDAEGCARPPEACSAFGDHVEHPHDGEVHLHAGVMGVLQALADPVRLAIVRRLAAGSECACGALGVPVSKSTLTHHLHVLRAAGLIVQREDGTRRMTSLDREGMEHRYPGLLGSVLDAPDHEAPQP